MEKMKAGQMRRILPMCAALLIILAAVVFVADCPPTHAQTPSTPIALGNWTQNVTPQSPMGRANAVMTYDGATHRVVLFGGQDGNNKPLNDTWDWNGITGAWRLDHPTAQPSARWSAAAAYDTVSATVVLFGGSTTNNRLLGDTWTWDGSVWTVLSPVISPPPRAGAAMVYDEAHRVSVLFGGTDQDGNSLNDTWTWDGVVWTQQNPATSPDPRALAAMVYDPFTRNAVLFGGCCSGDRTAHTSTSMSDTWVWDGVNWTRQQPLHSPPARSDAAASYDPILASVLLFGGCGNGDNACRMGDTWLWDGTDWTAQQPLSAPQGRTSAALATDSATNTLLLFGGLLDPGNTHGADTWTWIGKLPAPDPLP
jgi:hypothetical protein